MKMKLRPQSDQPNVGWTDARLVRACLDGDEDAWTAIIDKYKRLIYSIPTKQGIGAADASDIFQAVCLELLRTLSGLREPQALAGWLIKVTVHKCYHWKRKESRYLPTLDSRPNDANPETADSLDLDALLEEVEREQWVREAVAALPKRCKSLISMLFFEFPPKPYTEVAEELGLARGSIGFIRRRCLNRLKRSLESKGF